MLPGELPLCGACRIRSDPPVLQQCIAAVDYAYPWDGLLARFKFRGEPGWARLFAAQILHVPATLPLLRTCGLVVPVPLTPRRLGERGYNQSWELVKALGHLIRRLGAAPTCTARASVLVRLGEAPDQHSLGRDERLRNLRGLFVVHPAHASGLAGQHVVLVDDVTTTGATLQSAAQALLQAGAGRVSALVFAHTPASR